MLVDEIDQLGGDNFVVRCGGMRVASGHGKAVYGDKCHLGIATRLQLAGDVLRLGLYFTIRHIRSPEDEEGLRIAGAKLLEKRNVGGFVVRVQLVSRLPLFPRVERS